MSIINNIRNMLIEKQILPETDKSKISAIGLNSGGYRLHENIQQATIWFCSGKPTLVTRWQQTDHVQDLENKISLQSVLSKEIKSIRVPRVVGVETVDSLQIIIEEFMPGVSLQRLISTEMIEIEAVTEILTTIQSGLDELAQESDLNAYNQELMNTFDEFYEYFKPDYKEEIMLRYLLERLKHLGATGKIHKRITNGDFIAANILYNSADSSIPILIDHEFIHETHFGFLDVFRFLHYSDPQTVNAIRQKQNYNSILELAFDKEELSRFYWSLFYIKDYLTKYKVLRNELKVYERENTRIYLYNMLFQEFVEDLCIKKDSYMREIDLRDSKIEEMEQQIKDLKSKFQRRTVKFRESKEKD